MYQWPPQDLKTSFSHQRLIGPPQETLAPGGGVLLGIRGGGMPPGSPNPGPVSDQKMSFFTPIIIMPSLLRLEHQPKSFVKIHFKFTYISFFLIYYFGLARSKGLATLRNVSKLIFLGRD